MFKSGNVLSSDGRGIVREVRVAVFAVISRHIRKRFSFVLSLSLGLLLLLLLLRATLLLILMYGLCLDVILFVVKIKRLLGSFFHGLISQIFSSSETRGSIFHTYTPQTHSYYFRRWVDERETRGLWRANDGEKKTRVCVSSVVRSREREREKLYCRVLLDIKWEKAWNLACGST